MDEEEVSTRARFLTAALSPLPSPLSPLPSPSKAPLTWRLTNSRTPRQLSLRNMWHDYETA
jgi:hypothetical protein